jgi:hypothetical protein
MSEELAEVQHAKGKVSSIVPTVSDNAKAPAGKITLAGSENEYTVWSKDKWGELKLGDEVEFEYKEYSKTYGEKTYTNRNINHFIDSEHQAKIDEVVDGLSSETKAKLKAVEETMKETGKLAIDEGFQKDVEENLEKNNIMFNIGDKVYRGYIWEVKE